MVHTSQAQLGVGVGGRINPLAAAKIPGPSLFLLSHMPQGHGQSSSLAMQGLCKYTKF